MNDPRLTVEQVRQHLCERVPDFETRLAVAFGYDVPTLRRHLEAGGITQLEAIEALARTVPR